jgi:hypothetical protein
MRATSHFGPRICTRPRRRSGLVRDLRNVAARSTQRRHSVQILVASLREVVDPHLEVDHVRSHTAPASPGSFDGCVKRRGGSIRRRRQARISLTLAASLAVMRALAACRRTRSLRESDPRDRTTVARREHPSTWRATLSARRGLLHERVSMTVARREHPSTWRAIATAALDPTRERSLPN